MTHPMPRPSPLGPTGSRPVARRPRGRLAALVLAVGGLAAAGCAGGVSDRAGAAPPAEIRWAAAQTGEAAQPGAGITVVGDGEVSVAPDRLVAHLGVEVRAVSAGEALTTASQRVQAMIDALTGAGVAEQDIQTVEVSLRPEQLHREPAPPDQPSGDRTTEYVATNIVRVEITPIDQAGAILDGAVGAGGDAAVIRTIQFAAEDPPLDEARAEAWRDATAKAQQLASLAGVTLGPAVSIQEIRLGGGGPLPVARDAAAAAESIPLQPGQVTAQVSVEVRFEITR
jgi:uncharacterized protein